MNYIKINSYRCHHLISGNKIEQTWEKLDIHIIWESKDVKLLGITSDNNLKFDKHVSNICSKANRKLSSQVAKFLPFKKRLILFKLLLSGNLNIVHSYGCLMEGK